MNILRFSHKCAKRKTYVGFILLNLLHINKKYMVKSNQHLSFVFSAQIGGEKTFIKYV